MQNVSLSHLIDQLSIDHRIALGCYDLDGNILNTPTPYNLIQRST